MVLVIKKNCDKILRFKQEMRDMGMSKKVKVMKISTACLSLIS